MSWKFPEIFSGHPVHVKAVVQRLTDIELQLYQKFTRVLRNFSEQLFHRLRLRLVGRCFFCLGYFIEHLQTAVSVATVFAKIQLEISQQLGKYSLNLFSFKFLPEFIRRAIFQNMLGQAYCVLVLFSTILDFWLVYLSSSIM